MYILKASINSYYLPETKYVSTDISMSLDIFKWCVVASFGVFLILTILFFIGFPFTSKKNTINKIFFIVNGIACTTLIVLIILFPSSFFLFVCVAYLIFIIQSLIIIMEKSSYRDDLFAWIFEVILLLSVITYFLGSFIKRIRKSRITLIETPNTIENILTEIVDDMKNSIEPKKNDLIIAMSSSQDLYNRYVKYKSIVDLTKDLQLMTYDVFANDNLVEKLNISKTKIDKMINQIDGSNEQIDARIFTDKKSEYEAFIKDNHLENKLISWIKYVFYESSYLLYILSFILTTIENFRDILTYSIPDYPTYPDLFQKLTQKLYFARGNIPENTINEYLVLCSNLIYSTYSIDYQTKLNIFAEMTINDLKKQLVLGETFIIPNTQISCTKINGAKDNSMIITGNIYENIKENSQDIIVLLKINNFHYFCFFSGIIVCFASMDQKMFYISGYNSNNSYMFNNFIPESDITSPYLIAVDCVNLWYKILVRERAILNNFVLDNIIKITIDYESKKEKGLKLYGSYSLCLDNTNSFKFTVKGYGSINPTDIIEFFINSNIIKIQSGFQTFFININDENDQLFYVKLEDGTVLN